MPDSRFDSRSAQRRIRPTVFIVSLALGACILEIGLWMWSASADSPTREQPRPSSDLPEAEGIFDLARPNQRLLYGGVPYQTNESGLRDRDFAVPKPRDVRRIAIIGDSVTAGSGVEVESSYPKLLEEALRGTNTEVINVGLPGANLRASLRRLKVALRYEPDLVIYGFTLNDLEDLDGYEFDRSVSGLRYEPALFHGTRSYLFTHVAHLLYNLRLRFGPPAGSYPAELDRNFANPLVWGQFEADLRELAELVPRGPRCGIVLIHTRFESLGPLHAYHRFYEQVADAATRAGLLPVFTFERFRGLLDRSLWVSAEDPHPNRLGHTIYAEALADALGELPPKCKAPIAPDPISP